MKKSQAKSAVSGVEEARSIVEVGPASASRSSAGRSRRFLGLDPERAGCAHRAELPALLPTASIERWTKDRSSANELFMATVHASADRS